MAMGHSLYDVSLAFFVTGAYWNFRIIVTTHACRHTLTRGEDFVSLCLPSFLSGILGFGTKEDYLLAYFK